MTADEIQRHTDVINRMSQIAMARLLRFAPSGHPYFDSRLPLNAIFDKRFKELGGMTTQISKSIGWDR